MDEFAVGEVMQSKRKKPFNIQFRNEKNQGKTIFLVHLKYVLDYIEELPEQLQWLKNIDEKNNDERKPPGSWNAVTRSNRTLRTRIRKLCKRTRGGFKDMILGNRSSP